MDSALFGKLLGGNQPFQIETASGRVLEVGHPDFVSFTASRTAVIISYQENGGDQFAIVPLTAITAVVGKPKSDEQFL